jgi:hypothetical protein
MTSTTMLYVHVAKNHRREVPAYIVAVEGVRVLSVCQETTEDPIGNFDRGIFECIDQYESE